MQLLQLLIVNMTIKVKAEIHTAVIKELTIKSGKNRRRHIWFVRYVMYLTFLFSGPMPPHPHHWR